MIAIERRWIESICDCIFKYFLGAFSNRFQGVFLSVFENVFENAFEILWLTKTHSWASSSCINVQFCKTWSPILILKSEINSISLNWSANSNNSSRSLFRVSDAFLIFHIQYTTLTVSAKKLFPKKFCAKCISLR